MIKQTVSYVDFNDKPRTEEFYFNLSETEILEMVAENESLEENLRAVVAANDGGKIMSVFKDLLRRSFGQKSEDGRRLMKGEEITRAFMESNAYNVLFLKLVTEPDYAATFIEGILPKNLDTVLKK